MDHSKAFPAQNAVIVRIIRRLGSGRIEDGKQKTQAFVTEEYAANFAVGQVIRLNVDHITREDTASSCVGPS